ncbi:hypothetical protein Hypma_012576 [Hypsizygus marmoreus]|uniref:HNH nuclease domain-containing protein n=1 Tax=Hypsizygus marmoreus TaxID=39966 RepID=A0A369JDZ9_HYPMA|nr:hypothetical protein Hypma_012576 [Hypsizygus marmoreus]
MSPEPLPSRSQIATQLPNVISAYDVCLQFEKFASTQQDPRFIISARVLGYLFLHAPSDRALAEVVNTIHSCSQDHDTLYALGEAFVTWFIRAFRKYKGRTPLSSDHSRSRPSFDRDRSFLKVSIQEAPKDHSTAKGQALVRDGYRCLISGKYDALARKALDLPLEEILKFGPAVYTECAHIVPASTYFNVNTANSNTDPNKKDYAASVLAVLKCFGYDVDKLNGANVHSLFNVMTLEKNTHDLFDQLRLWLDATDTPNCYRVQVADPMFFIPGRQLVTFSTPDPEHLPLPSADLLALHAACAKVAHLSGAAEYLDDFDRHLETSKVLAFDGGSAEVLRYAITRLAGEGIDVEA